MANLDAPMGFNPIRNPHGNTVPSDPYTVTASQAVAPGTIVYLTAAGTVQAYTGTTTGRAQILGAAVGSVSASATDRVVEVANDPNQEFEVQTDDNTVTALTDFIGANFAGTNLATVNTTLIQSRGEIDASSVTSVNNTTTIRPFKALRASSAPDDDITLANNGLIVKINASNHHLGAPLNSAGVL